MIVTISGKAGSGKSTVAKALAKELTLRHYSIGDLMRQIAAEKGISLLELSRLAEKDDSIDQELDERQMGLKQEDNFVIDGRLTAHFIPNATLKVFLDCDDTIRAERILKDKRKDERQMSVRQMIKKLHEREDSERKRYKQYYNVDYYDRKLYDMIIDTSHLTIADVLERILNVIEKDE